MSNKDQIQRVLFEEVDVRGVLVGLETSYQEALAKHGYPPLIERLLGELMAAAALLSANLKFEGKFILQAQGDGDVTLLMAECTEKHELRAIARFSENLPEEATLNQLLGNGRMALTIDPKQGQRYQGVVPLEGDNLAECLQAYFVQSEQLATRLHLVADDTQAAGFLLQVLPSHDATSDDWNRIRHLATTLSDAELLTLDNETLLYRLYHEEACRLYDGEAVSFNCDCSRERSLNSLKLLSKDELDEMLQEQSRIEMACQFCNEHYAFDQADIDYLYSGDTQAPSSGSVH
ncbi:MAG: Hsp33 family molecular chaperone HslO [Pontibacterium sp.]